MFRISEIRIKNEEIKKLNSVLSKMIFFQYHSPLISTISNNLNIPSLERPLRQIYLHRIYYEISKMRVIAIKCVLN